MYETLFSFERNFTSFFLLKSKNTYYSFAWWRNIVLSSFSNFMLVKFLNSSVLLNMSENKKHLYYILHICTIKWKRSWIQLQPNKIME